MKTYELNFEKDANKYKVKLMNILVWERIITICKNTEKNIVWSQID